MFLEKPKIGTSIFELLILYCSVLMPLIVSLSAGLPKLEVIAEFIILMNC